MTVRTRPIELTTRPLLLSLACMLTACAPLPQRAGIPTLWCCRRSNTDPLLE